MAKLTRLVLLLLVLLSGCDNYDPDRTAAYLADLGITGYQLEPSFSSSTFDYVATIPPGTDSITVEVTSTHQGATVTVNGILVESDGGSITLQLAEGTNTIKVVVLSSDNMRTQTYTVLVTGQWLSYSVGGAVSGLTGALTLQNNAGDDLAIAADGVFEFATPVTDGDDYAVTVSAQPDGQFCSVTNAAGTIAGANVSDVAVTCVDLVAGLFVDDLVVGLDYSCSSGTSSETATDGQFTCPQTDDISFWLGSNELGPISVAYSIITPLSLFPDDGLAAINLARLLQSLDSDLLPDNGVILIDEELVAALPANLDFSLQPDEFEAAVGMTLVSLETAVQRLRDAIAQYIPENTDPIADAGADRDVTVGATVTLSGAGSSDANGDGLTFTWNFVSTPAGSSAQLASRFTVAPSFVADVAGSYVVGVLVSDGTVINYDIVVITANDGSALPAAPLGLQVVAGDALITLSWTAVDGATGYMIYWNTTGNVTTSSNSSGPSTNTLDNFSGLNNGTTYYYRVAAVNASGEGSMSAEVSATPEAPGAGLPAMPDGVQAFAGDSLVRLNWTAVSGATSYTVYWNTTGGVLASDASIAAGSSTGLNHTGLTNGTNYYYRVAASNASGEGPLSATRLAIPTGPPPVVSYTVGGAVVGLAIDGTLTLQNNGTDDLLINQSGSYFTFPTAIPDGSAYNVTVSVQPDGQTCSVTYLGSGTISGANVTNVGVTCVDNAPVTYSVGGTVSGLTGTVTLQNNAADDLYLGANGSFTFLTQVDDGGSYSVSVGAQPAGQVCSVTNSAGTIAGANVTNVSVDCIDMGGGSASDWKWANPLPQGNNIIDMAWNGNQWVAIGEYGTILTSPDGLAWTIRVSDTVSQLSGIVWDGSQFVVVGAAGTVLTSPDGVTWTSQTSGTTNEMSDIVWTGSQLVAVGTGATGQVLTSSDGITWTLRSPWDASYYISRVAWNGSLLVVNVSTYPYNRPGLMTSPDGVTWTPVSLGTYELLDVATDGSQFVVTGNDVMFRSVDGVVWTAVEDATFGRIKSVTWDGNQWVATGEYSRILTSPDGVTWTRLVANFTGAIINVVVANGSQYFAAGNDGRMYNSADAVVWTSQTSGSFDILYDIEWTGTQFVVVGYDVASSPNGIDWAWSDYFGVLNSIAWSSDKFVAVGNSGVIRTSPIAALNSWGTPSSGTTSNLLGITWGNNQFVAVGAAIVTSPNGVTWTARTSELAGTGVFQDIVWTGSLFVAVGYGASYSAAVFTSPDGITWTNRPIAGGAPAFSWLHGIAWNGSQLVAVGMDGFFVTSPDGITWTRQTVGVPDWRFRDVTWTGSQFVAVGDYTTVLTSPDGVTWTSHNSISGQFRGVASDGGQVVIIGIKGILTNDTL